MANGSSKAIEDVEFGDLVCAADRDTGEKAPRKVARVISGLGDNTVVDIEIDGR